MLQKTQIKKRYSQEISEDPLSDEEFVAGNDNNIDEPQKNKHTKNRIENKQPSSERVTTDVNDDKPAAWLSALTERIRTDNRIGFPKKQPPIPELNHGWLMDANKEVLHVLIKPEFSKLILLSEHTISLKMHNDNTCIQHYILYLECIIELGSWLGRSANFIASEAPNAMIFAVDLWDNSIFQHDEHYSKSSMFIEILSNGPILQQFMRNTWEARYPRSSTPGSASASFPSGIVPMRMDSREALRMLKEIDFSPDLIYVDANHHYQPVLDDVSLCVELFPDALIVGDDWHYEEVQRAVKEVAVKHDKELYVHGSNCWTYSKRQCEEAFAPRCRTVVSSSSSSSSAGAESSTTQQSKQQPLSSSRDRVREAHSTAANSKFADLMKVYSRKIST